MRDYNELQQQAEQGHVDSQFMLGFMYARGQGAPRDINMARVWLERAAMANDPRAQYYLGELYGELGKADPRAAFSQMAFWWGKSASHPYWETLEGLDGRAISMRRLVWLQMHSGFENASAEEALRLLEELTNKYSSPRSAIELGIVIATGSFLPLTRNLGATPVQQDREKGIRLIERGVLIIENGSNDIDYSLYNTIAEVYLAQDSSGQRTQEELKKGIHFKKRAMERATGVNAGFVLNLRNEIAALEKELGLPATAAPVANSGDAPQNPEVAAKFAKFHDYFDSLDMEGKKNFITDLDQKLQVNPNPEYNAFLVACVEKYTQAKREMQALENSPENIEPQYNQGPQHAESYHAEEYEPEEYAPMDYGEYHDPAAVLDSENQGGFADYRPELANYDTASYTDRIHTYGSTSLFLFGAIMITLGSILLPISLGMNIYHPLGFAGYGIVLFLIFPVMGLWMVYVASKSPGIPERSLTGLTLFRVTAFTHLGLIAVGAALLALQFGGDGQALFGLSIFESPLDLVMVLGALAVIVLYVTFYYGSLFSMIKGIRDGMYSNVFEELPGVGAFSTINYIVNFLMIVGSVGVIALGFVDVEFIEIPEAVTQWFEPGREHISMAMIAFAIILSSAGAILCTTVLNQFNSSLINDSE